MPWRAGPGLVPDTLAVWRKEKRERRARVAVEDLKGEALVLDMADRMRRSGAGAPAPLYFAAVEAFRRHELAFDQVTPLYRHACLHARVVMPRDRSKLHVCPECEAVLSEAD